MRARLVLVASLLVAGCPKSSRVETQDAGTSEDAAPKIETHEHPSAAVTGAEVTVVTDPDALAWLESHGYSFGERFADAPAKEGAPATGAQLVGSPRYASLVAFIEQDLRSLLAQYHGKTPSIGTSKKTAREIDSKWALFDEAWLSSKASRFELVGVVNRFDRRLLKKRSATCGELRLIYRLAYTGPRESSRLPLTVIVVYPQASADCGEVARGWIASTPKPTGEAMARWLTSGPLRELAAKRAKPMAFELNALLELWSRFVHETDGVGAHHRYTLRVFRPDGDALAPEPLDQTPDVEAIVSSPEKKKALLAWIQANKDAIDAGHPDLEPLPDVGEVRATQTWSLTAMGLTRASNRPWSRIFVDDLASFRDAMKFSSDGEARAFLRRLDMTSCNGCHVTRSVLGFHLVGDERDAAAYRDPEAHASDPDLEVDMDHADGVPIDQFGAPRQKAPIAARVTANRMAVGISAHLRDEMDRRARDLRRYLAADSPTDFLAADGFQPMPPPDRGATLAGTFAAPCALPDAPAAIVGPDAKDLACASGFRCVALDDAGYGQCIVAYDRGGDGSARDVRSVGDPFELQKYSVETKGWASADPFLDRGPVVASLPCLGGGETGRDKGFPYGGICEPKNGALLVEEIENKKETGCKTTDGVVALGESGFLTKAGVVVSKPVDGARELVCGLAAFRASKTWGYMSTAAMAWNSISPGWQVACDLDHPCRDEYVCMRRLPRKDAGTRDPFSGSCVPGYLLNQLEIDAHKVPD